MNLSIRTTSGANYRVVDESMDLPDDVALSVAIDAVRDRLARGVAITVAIDFQGGGEAYREDRTFSAEHVESVGAHLREE